VSTKYLINMECTTCGLSLMESPRSAVNRIVFCTQCRSGGHYADVVDNGVAVTPEFVTLNELDAMLHAIGSEAD
jgi:hypothetical protein